MAAALGSFFQPASIAAKTRWKELNIGPFYVDSDSDPGAARDLLAQLEQARWVLGNLLEMKDLRPLWPVRIMLSGKGTGERSGSSRIEFVLQNSQYVGVLPSGSRPPLGEVAGLLLDDNTPRLPTEAESGLRQLFSTLEAHGSRVTWGGASEHADLAFARMQLFATKFEYGASFHIFLTALRGGSTLAAAERNAFGKSSSELESEAKANLAAGHWSAVPVSGRPLDPKRDFGEHDLDEIAADVFLAAYSLSSDHGRARSAFQAAVDAGGPVAALGYEGLAQLAELENQNAARFWEEAIKAGSHSPSVFLGAAKDRPAGEALPLLRRAALLNERWAEPIYAQVEFAESPPEKEALLKTVVKLDPRNTAHWIELAKLQTTAGEGTAAQGSWLRAEDSAPNETERNRVHELRLSYEQQRLDAAAGATRRDRDAARLADQEAQEAQADRVHAAERKANQALDSAGGDQKPDDAVTWSSLAGEKKMKGTLTGIECLRNGWRLSLKDAGGHLIRLFLSKDSHAALTCGPSAPPRRIIVQYRPAQDDDLHTSGEITNLQIQ